ncbi:MAG: F0F1 ATP synthase subunit delta [Pseudomonadales bacterium]
MAELATLARPYANAAFDIAKGDTALDVWSRMLALLGGAAETDAVQQLLETPEVEDSDKAKRLGDLFGSELNDGGKRFLQVLAENKRLGLLPEIAEQFEERRAEELQVLDVEVISAYPVSDAQAKTLADGLQRKFGREINMTSRVDDSLIGGAIIRAGDTVIDGSVAGRLTKLKETLGKT